ncbi:ParB/Srx family N-terminal domain-containing protein [Rhabdothermincola salaria]|uniref:ParB/Srx family N-terminal domain-containing protein n=1 Tax=Rhabdothermincola salaria TaxID=2903142 RepID=UPI001E306C78|nr:ParB/Srx family N-terminal domain-containing protein [Rhabdothermincola salaria]MCD9624278.1 ParB/Srx family N-terminal domain-containing protein [Rhabdothermincola salaria]
MADDQQYSVTSAREAASRDELQEWVGCFLASPGSDNAELAGILAERWRWWLGPVRLPIDRLHRLAGPSGDPVLRTVDDDYWRDDVEEMEDKIDEDGWEPPPVVVTFQDGQLVLEDGNHRVESLRRAGETEVWSIVGFDDPSGPERFRAPPPQ